MCAEAFSLLFVVWTFYNMWILYVKLILCHLHNNLKKVFISSFIILFMCCFCCCCCIYLYVLWGQR